MKPLYLSPPQQQAWLTEVKGEATDARIFSLMPPFMTPSKTSLGQGGSEEACFWPTPGPCEKS